MIANLFNSDLEVINKIKKEQLKASKEINSDIMDKLIQGDSILEVLPQDAPLPKLEEHMMTPLGPPSKDARIIQIPNHVSGLIIGKNAMNIKRLVKESSCRVHVANEKIPDTELRNVFIEGCEEGFQKAKRLIEEIIADQMTKTFMSHTGEANPFPGPHTKVEIPNNMVGLVIGKGGENINNLCMKTNCYVFIPKTSKPGEEKRVLEISGNSESGVNSCKQEILGVAYPSENKTENKEGNIMNNNLPMNTMNHYNGQMIMGMGGMSNMMSGMPYNQQMMGITNMYNYPMYDYSNNMGMNQYNMMNTTMGNMNTMNYNYNQNISSNHNNVTSFNGSNNNNNPSINNNAPLKIESNVNTEPTAINIDNIAKSNSNATNYINNGEQGNQGLIKEQNSSNTNNENNNVEDYQQTQQQDFNNSSYYQQQGYQNYNYPNLTQSQNPEMNTQLYQQQMLMYQAYCQQYYAMNNQMYPNSQNFDVHGMNSMNNGVGNMNYNQDYSQIQYQNNNPENIITSNADTKENKESCDMKNQNTVDPVSNIENNNNEV